MTIWEPLPNKVERKFKKHLTPYTLGNVLTMVQPADAADMTRKWFPDAHGTHLGVSGIGGSGP